MKNYYQLLSIAADAPADEVKKAFRREIARYHPDKVAHLGPEFLQIAEGRAAELTEGYRILIDPLARAQYDTQLRDASAPAVRVTPVPATDVSAGVNTPPSGVAFSRERATRDEFVRRAALGKLREALQHIVGDTDGAPAQGFDAGFLARPRRGLFGRSHPPVRVLARFVSVVDSAAVEETWPMALKSSKAGTPPPIVLLLGSGLAPSADLAATVAALRRKLRGEGPVLVPVDVRDWSALVPTDAPPGVRTLLDSLKK